MLPLSSSLCSFGLQGFTVQLRNTLLPESDYELPFYVLVGCHACAASCSCWLSEMHIGGGVVPQIARLSFLA